MRTRQWMQIAALASTVGLMGTAIAADNANIRRTAANDAMTSPLGQTPETAGVGGNDQTKSQNFDAWMNTYGTAHNGRVSREEFMNQMNNRWDRLDSERHGYLTPDQARGIYGPGQMMRPGRPAPDVTPGKLGPANDKAE